MTFSIIAFDPSSGRSGIAAATKNLAIGAVGYLAKPSVGIAAPQADVNTHWAHYGLKLLELGIEPQDVLPLLTKMDENSSRRQIHFVDRFGRSAGWTGDECISWAGHYCYQYFSVAGNILVGPEVLQEMANSYLENQSIPFGERLLRALEAGQSAGGDRRGKQSAALYIMGHQMCADLDLRVDDHSDPISELQRIFTLSQQEPYARFRAMLPSNQNPSGVYEEDQIMQIIKQRLQIRL